MIRSRRIRNVGKDHDLASRLSSYYRFGTVLVITAAICFFLGCSLSSIGNTLYGGGGGGRSLTGGDLVFWSSSPISPSSSSSAYPKRVLVASNDTIGQESLVPSLSSTSSQKTYNNNNNNDDDEEEAITKKTAVVIFTHLINAHPSLDPLLLIYNTTKQHLTGLPTKAPIIITVDGIRDVMKKREQGDLFLMDSMDNRNKYDEYLLRLNRYFKDDDNVRIIVAGKNIGLSSMIGRVLDNLSYHTKYMYLIQHDLPFLKDINHTDVLDTVESHPEMNLVGFAGPNGPPTWSCGQRVVSQSTGRVYQQFRLWTDRNHFVRTDHYRNDILPLSETSFPEDNMHKPARKNCTYFGPFYYDEGKNGPFYDHTDASERYGLKLAERIKNGELDYSVLTDVNIMIMKKMGVNMTELEQYKKE